MQSNSQKILICQHRWKCSSSNKEEPLQSDDVEIFYDSEKIYIAISPSIPRDQKSHRSYTNQSIGKLKYAINRIDRGITNG
jgi:hypothetical protein